MTQSRRNRTKSTLTQSVFFMNGSSPWTRSSDLEHVSCVSIKANAWQKAYTYQALQFNKACWWNMAFIKQCFYLISGMGMFMLLFFVVESHNEIKSEPHVLYTPPPSIIPPLCAHSSHQATQIVIPHTHVRDRFGATLCILIRKKNMFTQFCLLFHQKIF